MEEKEKPKQDNELMNFVSIICLILVVILLIYTIWNVRILSTNPCRLCEDMGFRCMHPFYNQLPTGWNNTDIILNKTENVECRCPDK